MRKRMLAVQIVILILIAAMLITLSGYRNEPVCYKINGTPMECDAFWAGRNR